MERELLDRIVAHLRGQRDEMVALQQALTPAQAMGPENGGVGEWAKARVLRAFLEKIGVPELASHDAPDERVPEGSRPNLVARLPGRSAHRTVWVMGHMDVVPPGALELWESDPWTVVVRPDRVIGRGVEDNQQGCVSGVFALKALIELAIEPPGGAGVMLMADEELGSTFGARFLAEQPGLIGPSELLVIPDAGNADGTMIEVAEKAALRARIHTRGRQCHASDPAEGVNAFVAASHLVVRLEGLARVFDAVDPLYAPPVSTFAPTKKEANIPNINTIPGDDVFYLDCRVLPRYAPRAVYDEIARIAAGVERDFGVAIEIEPRDAPPAAPPTAPDAEVVVRLQRAVRQVTGREARPLGIGGGTVAAIFRRRGLPAAVWGTFTGSAHQPNEYCLIDNMVSDAQVFACLMADDGE